MISPDEVAAAIADTIELPSPPLRVPVGRPAQFLMAALHGAPADQPFTP